MPLTLNGVMHFPGIQTFHSGQYTLTAGTRPGVCRLLINPQAGYIPHGGTLTISDGFNTIKLPDCRVIHRTIETDDSGFTMLSLYIADRRWKWENFGIVSGYYNIRRGDGNQKLDNEKNPKELLTILLKAMGEKKYDLSRVPNTARPEIEWDSIPPVNALGALLDEINCRIAYNPSSNGLTVWPRGMGKPLPQTPGRLISGTVTADPPEMPDKVIFRCGPSRWQLDLDLEAVGIEPDGEIRLVDQLSYTPPGNGWGAVIGSNVKDPRMKELARQCVYRWYRPVVPAAGIKVADDKGGKWTIKKLSEILPLQNSQVELLKAEGNKKAENRPAWVYGQWWGGNESLLPEAEAIVKDLDNVPESLYKRGFQLDSTTGIVKFSQPVYLADQKTLPGVNKGGKPAKLKLRIAVSVRDPKTLGWIYHDTERKTGSKSGTMPRYIVRTDIGFTSYVDKAGVTKTNKAEVDKQAKYYLDAEMRNYQLKDPESYVYTGIMPIESDGAITSVTWGIDGQGFSSTSASRQIEDLEVAPSYAEQRQLEHWRQQKRIAEGRDGNRAREREAVMNRG